MAKIEIIKAADEDSPRSVECLEVLVRGKGSIPRQQFCIGSGANFNGSGNFWLEIRYSLQDIPIFYTRSVLAYLETINATVLEASLDQFLKDQVAGFGFGDMLPETSVTLHRTKFDSTGFDGESHTTVTYSLKVSADLGAVFGHGAPGERMLDLRIEDVSLDDGVRFMRDLIQEICEASQGRHPDPARLLPGHSDWPFALQLTRQAYDRISVDYKENYFAKPALAEAFDGWLAELPVAGHILDAGCGHGDPVIARLLAKGLRVTGSDFSSAMLARASTQFPAAQFWECAITEIQAESIFDAACSFSSMLYLDPIDIFHAIHRLYRAIKPGGLLFLYAYDLHPNWRGQPYHVDLNQWMWGETYGMDEIACALEEHGYFQVLKALDTSTEEENLARIESWRTQTLKYHEELVKKLPPDTRINPPDLTKPPAHLAYDYIVIAKRNAQPAPRPEIDIIPK